MFNRWIPSRGNCRTLISLVAGQNRASQSMLRKTYGCDKREVKRYLQRSFYANLYQALYNMPDWIIAMSDIRVWCNSVWDERTLSPLLKCLAYAPQSPFDMVLILFFIFNLYRWYKSKRKIRIIYLRVHPAVTKLETTYILLKKWIRGVVTGTARCGTYHL